MALNARQRAFVEAYAGNAAEAARLAGYSVKTARTMGQALLTKPDIARAIQEREAERLKEVIADRNERLAFLTSVMRDNKHGIMYRLKAADQLSKACGDYLLKTEVSGPNGAPVQVAVSQDLTRLGFTELTMLDALLAKAEGNDEPWKQFISSHRGLERLSASDDA